jgi:hypothetical protein
VHTLDTLSAIVILNNIILLLLVLSSFSCSEQTAQSEPRYYLDNRTSTDKIENLIQSELNEYKLQPSVIINNEGQEVFDVLGFKIKWAEADRGVSISVNDDIVETKEMKTLNNVWGYDTDSLNFANYVNQIYVYGQDSIFGFVLNSNPCNGLGCGVNYQLIFDLKTNRTAGFGRFRTGADFGLYDFKRNGRIDYLSKSFYGRNQSHIDSTEYEIYSQLPNGTFELLKDENGLKYNLIHIRPLFDSIPESMIQHWTEEVK